MADGADHPVSFLVVISEQAEEDRDRAFEWLLLRDADFASLWLAGLQAEIEGLADFPGPRAHAIDEELSSRYGFEVRRLLYHGPRGRRMRVGYRIIYTLLPPAPEAGAEWIIRILRIFHGAQDIGSARQTDEEV